MPKITLIAEMHYVYLREVEVSDEELAEIQEAFGGGQDEAHLMAEQYLDGEDVFEDSGFESPRIILPTVPA